MNDVKLAEEIASRMGNAPKAQGYIEFDPEMPPEMFQEVVAVLTDLRFALNIVDDQNVKKIEIFDPLKRSDDDVQKIIDGLPEDILEWMDNDEGEE